MTTVSITARSFLLPYAASLRDAGYEVDLATNGVELEEKFRDFFNSTYDICWTRSPLNIRKNFRAYFEVRKVIQSEHFDIIHTHTPIASAIVRLVARRSHNDFPKIIYTAHGFHHHSQGSRIKNWVFYAVENYLARFTDVILTTNDEDYESAKSFTGNSSVLLTNGVGISFGNLRTLEIHEKTILRENMQIPARNNLIIFVGELNDNKRPIDLIDAAEIAFRDREDVTILIVGEGPLERESNQRAISSSLDIRVLGYRPDAHELIAISDILVSCSVREGLGMVLLEAMAQKCLVISSDHRGARQIVPQKYRYPIKDIYALAHLLEGCERLPETLEANFETASKYEITLAISNYLELISEVIEAN